MVPGAAVVLLLLLDATAPVLELLPRILARARAKPSSSSAALRSCESIPGAAAYDAVVVVVVLAEEEAGPAA